MQHFKMSLKKGRIHSFFHITTQILTLFESWLITLSQAIPCKSKVALEQISEWKGATQSSKPLSISIKLHCYAFNKDLWGPLCCTDYSLLKPNRLIQPSMPTKQWGQTDLWCVPVSRYVHSMCLCASLQNLRRLLLTVLLLQNAVCPMWWKNREISWKFSLYSTECVSVRHMTQNGKAKTFLLSVFSVISCEKTCQ